MKIDRDEARRIAALSHLEFDDAGLDRMAGEMTAILNYVDQLNGAPASAGLLSTLPAEAGAPLREDVVQPSIDRELVERNAPSFRDGHFVVPRVVGE